MWQSSLEALRSAKRWIFVGYSLPNEDIAIRALLLRALRGRKCPPSSVHVYIHGASGNFNATKERYRFLFPGCAVSGKGLEGLIGLS